MSNNRPMPLQFPIALVLSFVCLALPAWADGQAGMDAYTRGNYATALREWRPLAEQGDANAQNNLGGLYEFGHGVTQDYVRAYMWYNVAAAHSTGDAQKDVAAESRDEIAGRMTPAQIAEAQKLAREWKPIKQ